MLLLLKFASFCFRMVLSIQWTASNHLHFLYYNKNNLELYSSKMQTCAGRPCMLKPKSWFWLFDFWLWSVSFSSLHGLSLFFQTTWSVTLWEVDRACEWSGKQRSGQKIGWAGAEWWADIPGITWVWRVARRPRRGSGVEIRLNRLPRVHSHLTFCWFIDILTYPRSAFYYFKNY